MLFDIAERIGDRSTCRVDEWILYCWWVEVVEEVLLVSEKKGRRRSVVIWSIDAQPQCFPVKGSRGGGDLVPSSQTALSDDAAVVIEENEMMKKETNERND